MPTAPTIDDLMTAVGQYQSGAKAATDQILSITGKEADIANSQAATLTQQATDDSTVEAAKQAAALRTQSARIEAANAFHINLDDVGEQIHKYAAMADDAQQAKDDALAEISRKDSTSLLDNPLDWIMNKFTINADIAKHNDANAVLASANERIASMNANTQSTIITQNAITAPITAASAEAATRNAAAKATLDAKTAQEQGLQYNLQGIQAVMGASKEDLNTAFQLNNAKNAETQTKIALEHLALSKQEFAFRQQEWQDKQDDKADQNALGQSVLDSINRGRLTRGEPAMDDVSGKMVLASLKGKTPLSQAMNADYESGERSKLTGVNSIGASPAQSAMNLNALPYKLAPAQIPIKDLLAASASDVSSAVHSVQGTNTTNPALQGLAGSKDKDQLAHALNNVAQGRLNVYNANINPGDASNPYNIGSVNVLAKSSQVIQNLPVYQKVLQPLVEQGVDVSDPKKMATLVGDAVAKGTITHEEAMGMATIFQVGVANNLATRNFESFGLVPKKQYNSPIAINSGGFHSTAVIDYTNPEAVSRAIIQKQASDMATQNTININTAVQ